MSISLEEARALMTEEALENLRNNVTIKPTLNMTAKINNDIIMQALCNAVVNKTIKQSSLDDKLVKLLNSATNTLSASKLKIILGILEKTQSDIVCNVIIKDASMNDIIQEWTFNSNNVDFNMIFEYVVSKFDITPSKVRQKMVNVLKPTIVNNIGQLVAKYKLEMNTTNLNVSITTITRLVNMENFIIYAEFVERK